MEKKYSKTELFKRLMKYNRPKSTVFFAILFSIFSAGVFPFFGLATIKMTFALMIPDKGEMWDEADKWILAMLIGVLAKSFV